MLHLCTPERRVPWTHKNKGRQKKGGAMRNPKTVVPRTHSNKGKQRKRQQLCESVQLTPNPCNSLRVLANCFDCMQFIMNSCNSLPNGIIYAICAIHSESVRFTPNPCNSLQIHSESLRIPQFAMPLCNSLRICAFHSESVKFFMNPCNSL